MKTALIFLKRKHFFNFKPSYGWNICIYHDFTGLDETTIKNAGYAFAADKVYQYGKMNEKLYN